MNTKDHFSKLNCGVLLYNTRTMRFEVPQFIEIEDKIFGPLTLKQFIYLAGTAGLCFVIYSFLPFFLAVIIMAPFIVFGLALAFYRHNNRPFITLVESWFNYTIKGKLYIWQKRKKPVEQEVDELAQIGQAPVYVPKLSDSKLKDLSWSLDVSERRRGDVL